ncbi:MAG: hypothetical protein H7338_18885 [Candidatus Sericytochromatia bacterium]|nr:hypothetical protein [Candidatus Sericytochromatia bacterium]
MKRWLLAVTLAGILTGCGVRDGFVTQQIPQRFGNPGFGLAPGRIGLGMTRGPGWVGQPFPFVQPYGLGRPLDWGGWRPQPPVTTRYQSGGGTSQVGVGQQPQVGTTQSRQVQQLTVAAPKIQPLLNLVPKGPPQIGAPTGGISPSGVPHFTQGILRLMPGSTVSLVLRDGTELKGFAQTGQNQTRFSLNLTGGASITGVLQTQVGEPFTVAYIVTDKGGRVFTVRQEYSHDPTAGM